MFVASILGFLNEFLQWIWYIFQKWVSLTAVKQISTCALVYIQKSIFRCDVNSDLEINLEKH